MSSTISNPLIIPSASEGERYLGQIIGTVDGLTKTLGWLHEDEVSLCAAEVEGLTVDEFHDLLKVRKMAACSA